MSAKTLRTLLLAGLTLVVLTSMHVRAWAQTNFKPLEPGDYTEVEERIVALRGMEVGLDYAMRVRRNQYKGLPSGQDDTQLQQDVWLKLRTVFHRDVSLHLTLEPAQTAFKDSNIRVQPPDDSQGGLTDGQTMGINARELYLSYNFNPRSALLTGKQEVSVGDRRGKVFDAIVDAFTFDCYVGTWCMPFGTAILGPRTGDALYHWALQYTAWDQTDNGFRSALEVGIFRIIYTEANVPLGKNLGPTVFDPKHPTDTDALDSQYRDPASGEPIYYDSRKQNYFGLRINWEAGQFFWNFDVTSNQGSRDYHRYRDPHTGIVGLLANSAIKDGQNVQGVAAETEIGYRWPNLKLGVRLMNATGDPYVDPTSDKSFLRTLKGYYEITPGTYQGTRLYFNGGGSSIDSGAGLGHSINNTRQAGFFLDYDERENKRYGYQLGLYKLTFNHSIPNADGKMVSDIGVEWDNMLTWYVHKALKFQFEVNLIDPSGAFRTNDFTAPDVEQKLFTQTLGRLVYSF